MKQQERASKNVAAESMEEMIPSSPSPKTAQQPAATPVQCGSQFEWKRLMWFGIVVAAAWILSSVLS